MASSTRLRSRSDTVIGIVFSVVLLAAVGFGIFWFWSDARDGRSPSIVAWVMTGLVAFSVGVFLGWVVSKVFRLGEGKAQNVQAIFGMVLLAAVLLAAYAWVDVQQGPLAATLGPACRGEAVPGTATAGATGPLGILVVDDGGHKTDWTTADAAWRAGSVGETALVACVDRHDDLIETCHYVNVGNRPRSFRRYASVVGVRVVAADTGRLIDRFELRDEPRACQQTEREGQGDLHGSVAFDKLATALEPYAAGVSAAH